MPFASPPPVVPLNLRQIEVFHAIMASGSLSEAGRQLCVSQPSVSRVLATAESRLRFALFERVRGRLQATPEARRLHAQVEDIMAGVRQFNALAGELAQGKQGKLSLVSSPSYGEWLMPRAISRFRERHPGVQVTFRPMPFDALVPHLTQGRADLCVASMLPPPEAALAAQTIGEGSIRCAVPRHHPLAARASVRAQDLHGHTLIGYGAGTPFGELTQPFLRAAEIETEIVVRSTPEALAMVRQEVGVALVESFELSPDQRGDILLKPIEPGIGHGIYLLHPRSTPLSNLAKGFAATLRHQLQAARSPSRFSAPL